MNFHQKQLLEKLSKKCMENRVGWEEVSGKPCGVGCEKENGD